MGITIVTLKYTIAKIPKSNRRRHLGTMEDLKEIICMAAVDAPNSYAANSILQVSPSLRPLSLSTSHFRRHAISKGKTVLKQSVQEFCSAMLPGTKKLVVADLGCSYGPNAFTVISEVMDAVGESCRKLCHSSPPEVQFFLNDLPANDFNDVFRSLASYKKQLREEQGEELAGRLYVAGIPGSFYGRLFPCRSVHLFHSSSSVHWLSQVPEGLKDEHNNELNKGNIYVGRTSPPCVHKAYLQQFQRDFSTFLGCRSEEIQEGGLMVLTVIAKSSSDPLSGAGVLLCDFLAEVLMSMAEEGTIKEDDIDALNLPFYHPYIEEVQATVDAQGSFQIAGQSVVELNGDGFVAGDVAGDVPSAHVRGQNAVRILRASVEALFACHFGEENIVVDDMFDRLTSILTREYENGEELKCSFYICALKRGCN